VGKKLDPREAEKLMMGVGLKPLEPYLGVQHKWKCQCTKCGEIVFSRLASAKKGSGCNLCGHKRGGEKNRLSERHLLKVMLNAGLKPLESYKKSSTRWKSKCINCNQIVFPIFSNIAKGHSGCGFCAGQKAIKGVNDIKSLNPDLAREAYGWDPALYMLASNKKLEWKCKKGHIWSATPSTRKRSNCPFCSGRVVITGETDFATVKPELVKYVDGWDPSQETASSGKKKTWKCDSGHTWQAPISSVSRGNFCPYCSNHKVLVGFNDLKTTHPDIAKEAYGWNPETIVAGSPKILQWKCTVGHIWKSSSEGRIKNGQVGTGCSYCSNRKLLVGFNDLATVFPSIAKEANGWDPSNFLAGTTSRMSWRCEKGHEWKTGISNRTGTYKTGCPYCANKKVLTGFNDLATVYPEIAKEACQWNPSVVLAGSAQRMKWICKEKHIWITSIDARTGKQGSGCPSCANFGFDPNLYGYLYFINHESWQMFQIGITNYPDKRLKDHSSQGWELIEIRGPMDGHLTKNWEKSILCMLKAKGADLSNSEIAGKFDGYSEAWSKSTFLVKSIKDLMQMTEEFEEEKSVANLSHRRTKKD
jgi:hypothetical protein